MEETKIESSHLNKPAYRSKKWGKKTTVKAMINTRNSKRINMKMLINDIKIIKYGQRI